MDFAFYTLPANDEELESIADFLEKYILQKNTGLSSAAIISSDDTLVAATSSWKEDMEGVNVLIQELSGTHKTSVLFGNQIFIVVNREPEKRVIAACQEKVKLVFALAGSAVLFLTHEGGLGTTPKAAAITNGLARYLDANLARGKKTKSARKV